MITILSDEFAKLRKDIESTTGFSCFEPSKNEQLVFYGTSDKLAAFKAKVEGYIPTGTVAYCIDTKSSEMWSDFKSQWY